MSKKEYFAYGSNLNFEQMAYRCPEATAVGTAKLDGYELAFRRGYLTVLPKEGASVEGLIWSITDHDESQLDCYEGYPTFYDKETMTVTDADGTPHKIMVYTMNPVSTNIPPLCGKSTNNPAWPSAQRQATPQVDRPAGAVLSLPVRIGCAPSQAAPSKLCRAAGCLQVRPAHPADGVFI